MNDLPYAEHVSLRDRTRLAQLVAAASTLDDAYRLFGAALGEYADGRSPINLVEGTSPGWGG